MTNILKALCGIGMMVSLTACSDETTQEPAKVVEKTEAAPVVVEEQPKAKTSKTEITFAEFDKAFERDPEEKEYIDGPFILKDGTTKNADFISYVGGDLFEYASAIFYEGKLVHTQMETSATIDELEKGLGITFDDSVKVEPYLSGYEITWDETFADENIKLFPFELD